MLSVEPSVTLLLLAFMISLALATFRTRCARLNAIIWIIGVGETTTLPGQMTAVVDTTAYRPGVIEGVVVNGLTGKSIEGASVHLVGSNSACVSGAGGEFRLRNIFPGTRTIQITADGMRGVGVVDIAVQPGRMVRLQAVELRPQPVDGVEQLGLLTVNARQLLTNAGDFATSIVPLAQVVVVPSHHAVIEEAVASGSDLRRGDLDILPQNGEDLYRAIARLPGLSTSDTGTRFWVRGAPNDQVLTRYDGVELLEPFHIKGFDGALSIVDLETVSRLDLVTGGFTAKYGERMAGVLTMETESFNPAEPRNTLGVSLTGARAISRGDFATGQGTWTAEARSGYPGAVVEDDRRQGEDLKTRYADLTAKVEYLLTPDQAVSLHFLHSRDTLTFKDVDTPYLTSNYGSDYLWGRWRGKFGERLYGETVLSLAYLSWRHREAGVLGGNYNILLKDNRDLTTATLRQDWTMVFSDRALIQGGFEYTSGESDYSYYLVRDRPIQKGGPNITIQNHLERNKSLKVDGQNAGIYFAPRVRLTPQLIIEPSLRFDRQTIANDKDVSPRFNASYTLGRTTIRGAWGIFYQSQGPHQLGIVDQDDTFHPAERAEHRVLSVEHRLVSGIEVRMEIYERILSRLRPHWENLVDVDEAFPEMKYDRRLLSSTNGVARGAEWRVEDRSPGRFNWAVSYTLAETKEMIGGRAFPRPRDQRHTFALDLSYTPSPRWRLSAAWQYHTGWPSTEVTFTDMALPTGEQVVVGEVGPSYAQRMPAYHRLDLRVTREVFFKEMNLRIFADLFNAYNRRNIQGYTYSPVLTGQQVITSKKAQIQIPLTPNVGVVWEF